MVNSLGGIFSFMKIDPTNAHGNWRSFLGI